MSKCKNCNCEHDSSYGTSGLYCSAECSKIGKYKKEYKITPCIQCGILSTVDKRACIKKVLCIACKGKEKELRSTHACPICGEIGYKNSNCPCPDICKKRQLILKGLTTYFGFNKNTLGTLNAYKEFERIKEEIFNTYWIDELSIPQIAEKYNYPDGVNIEKILTNMGLTYRSASKSLKLAIKNGRATINTSTKNYKNGNHIDWQGNIHYFRSSYEEDLMFDLDDFKIQYQTETQRIYYWDNILNTERVAVVDIYLPDYNTLIEVKSTYTLDLLNMKDKFISYKKEGYKSYVILDKEHVLTEDYFTNL